MDFLAAFFFASSVTAPTSTLLVRPSDEIGDFSTQFMFRGQGMIAVLADAEDLQGSGAEEMLSIRREGQTPGHGISGSATEEEQDLPLTDPFNDSLWDSIQKNPATSDLPGG